MPAIQGECIRDMRGLQCGLYFTVDMQCVHYLYMYYTLSTVGYKCSQKCMPVGSGQRVDNLSFFEIDIQKGARNTDRNSFDAASKIISVPSVKCTQFFRFPKGVDDLTTAG